jgi:hypothetical protein
MGWAGGSEIGERIAKVVEKVVPNIDAKRKIYKAMLDALSENDCDTLAELKDIDPILDQLLEKEGYLSDE